MRSHGILTAALLAALGIALTCRAAFPADIHLRWSAQRAEVHASISDTYVVAYFPFRNIGDQIVSVLSTSSSCGCTIPELEKTVYRPGETGRLKAVFNFDGRTGVQEKNITVRTDEPASPIHVLTLRVHIPEFARVQPGFLLWSPGMERAARRIRVEFRHDSPVRLVRVLDPSGKFSCEVRPLAGGRHYEVLISPPRSGSADAHLTLQTDTPRDNPRHLSVYVKAL